MKWYNFKTHIPEENYDCIIKLKSGNLAIARYVKDESGLGSFFWDASKWWEYSLIFVDKWAYITGHE